MKAFKSIYTTLIALLISTTTIANDDYQISTNPVYGTGISTFSEHLALNTLFSGGLTNESALYQYEVLLSDDDTPYSGQKIPFIDALKIKITNNASVSSTSQAILYLTTPDGQNYITSPLKRVGPSSPYFVPTKGLSTYRHDGVTTNLEARVFITDLSNTPYAIKNALGSYTNINVIPTKTDRKTVTSANSDASFALTPFNERGMKALTPFPADGNFGSKDIYSNSKIYDLDFIEGDVESAYQYKYVIKNTTLEELKWTSGGEYSFTTSNPGGHYIEIEESIFHPSKRIERVVNTHQINLKIGVPLLPFDFSFKKNRNLNETNGVLDAPNIKYELGTLSFKTWSRLIKVESDSTYVSIQDPSKVSHSMDPDGSFNYMLKVSSERAVSLLELTANISVFYTFDTSQSYVHPIKVRFYPANLIIQPVLTTAQKQNIFKENDEVTFEIKNIQTSRKEPYENLLDGDFSVYAGIYDNQGKLNKISSLEDTSGAQGGSFTVNFPSTALSALSSIHLIAVDNNKLDLIAELETVPNYKLRTYNKYVITSAPIYANVHKVSNIKATLKSSRYTGKIPLETNISINFDSIADAKSSGDKTLLITADGQTTEVALSKPIYQLRIDTPQKVTVQAKISSSLDPSYTMITDPIEIVSFDKPHVFIDGKYTIIGDDIPTYTAYTSYDPQKIEEFKEVLSRLNAAKDDIALLDGGFDIAINPSNPLYYDWYKDAPLVNRAFIENIEAIYTAEKAALAPQLQNHSDVILQWSQDYNAQPTAGNEFTPTKGVKSRSLLTVSARHAFAPDNLHYARTLTHMPIYFVEPKAPQVRMTAPYRAEAGINLNVNTHFTPSDRSLIPLIRSQYTLPDGTVSPGQLLSFTPTTNDFVNGYLTIDYTIWVDGYRSTTEKTLSRKIKLWEYAWPEYDFRFNQRFTAAPTPFSINIYRIGYKPPNDPTVVWELPPEFEVRYDTEYHKAGIFKDPGTYTFKATISDERGNVSNLEKVVTIDPMGVPIIDFRVFANNRDNREPLSMSIYPRMKGNHPADYVTKVTWEILSLDSKNPDKHENGDVFTNQSTLFLREVLAGNHDVKVRIDTTYGNTYESIHNFNVADNSPPICTVEKTTNAPFDYYNAYCQDLDGYTKKYRWMVDGNEIASYSNRLIINYTLPDAPTSIEVYGIDDAGEESLAIKAY